MDRLASLLSRFELRARVFNTGPLCSTHLFDAVEGVGHVHLLRSGAMTVETPGQPALRLTEPTLVFYMRPTTHSLVPHGESGAETLCGSIDFGLGLDNPLARALPPVVVIPLAAAGRLQQVLDLLFAEAFNPLCGRQAALDRLCELLVIHLLRQLMSSGAVDAGLLAGLADARLVKALNVIHAEPAYPWTLDNLAQRAGMSRARFAVNFRDTVGMTPGDYLASWRVGIAQSLLLKGKAVNWVAQEVGYSGPAALARVFNRYCGASPLAWLKQATDEPTPQDKEIA